MLSEILTFAIFLLIGLELRAGLAQPKAALLPAFAALGGMLLPAGIYFLLQPHSPAWAVTMPTDVVLALGALSLLGSKINPEVRLFLLTLAVADDLFSLGVIAIFFRENLDLTSAIFTLGAAAIGALLPLNKTLISVLAPIVTYTCIPVYVLINLLMHLDFSVVSDSETITIAFARVFGKSIGIALFAWIGKNLLRLRLPSALDLREIFGVGLLAGMGLTVSLVIGEITLGDGIALTQVRMGLFLAAITSGVLGLAWLKRFPASLSS